MNWVQALKVEAVGHSEIKCCKEDLQETHIQDQSLLNLQLFKHPVHMLHRYLYYYYCLTDINTEIKEVIFNFSLCKVRECRLRSGVNWQEMFKPKRHKTRPGCMYVNNFYQLSQQNRLCSLFIKTDMFLAVKTFIMRSIQSLIQFCIYEVRQ